MPIPKPNVNESKDDFISRCMGDEITNTEYPKEDQRLAACNSQWEGDANFADIKDLLNDEYEEINDVEIFNIYPNAHNIKFVEKDLDEMVNNFQRYEKSKRPNVKLSHSDEQLLLKELFNLNRIPLGEELPNMGYLYNMRKRGQSLVADIKDIPKVLKDKVYNGRIFKTISPEIILNHRGTGMKFIQSIGLTNNPSLKHIPDVHMSEALGYGGELNIVEGGQVMTDEEKKVAEEAAKGKGDVQLSESAIKSLMEKFSDFFKKEKVEKPEVDKEKIVTMAEIEKVKDSIKAEYESQLNDLKAKLIDEESKQQNFGDTLKKIEHNARLKEAEAICKSAQMEGVPPTVVQHFKPVLLSEFGETMIKFSGVVDGETIEAEKSLNSFITELFKNYPDKIDMMDKTVTELTSPSDDKYKKINSRVNDLMTEGKTKHEALTIAGQEA